MRKRRTLQADVIREIAVAAKVDPRTVEKVVAGEPVNTMARKRALRALQLAGLA